MVEFKSSEPPALLGALLADPAFRARVRAMLLTFGPDYFTTPFERVMFAETFARLVGERKAAEGADLSAEHVQALTDAAFALSYEFTDEARAEDGDEAVRRTA